MTIGKAISFKSIALCSIVLGFLTGCAGYAFKQQSNPFEHYGIKSISVPNFYNKSQLPRASVALTSRIYRNDVSV